MTWPSGVGMVPEYGNSRIMKSDKREAWCLMERVMTISEIESEFDSEWVLVDEPETNEQLEVLKGKVIHHSKDRDEVYRKAVSLRPKRSAILYTGSIPEGTVVVL
jgi:hypothetical protein